MTFSLGWPVGSDILGEVNEEEKLGDAAVI